MKAHIFRSYTRHRRNPRGQTGLTLDTGRAIPAAAIDIAFVAVLDAVTTGRRCAARLAAALAALAIRIHAATPTLGAGLARAATTIDVSLVLVLIAIVAADRLTGAVDAVTFATVGRAIAQLRERAGHTHRRSRRPIRLRLAARSGQCGG